MAPRVTAFYRKLGRVEKLFFAFLLFHLLLRFSGLAPGLSILAGIFAWALGIVAAVRLARRGIGKLIWRLRNRLIVNYLFIAVVPILLILMLASIATYIVTGQVAVYLVSSELNRRINALKGSADALARAPGRNQPDVMRRFSGFIASRFPNAEVFIGEGEEYHYPAASHLRHPPAGWKDASGVVLRDGRPFGWAHALGSGGEVTIVAPLTHELLSELVPGLGDVYFLNLSGPPVPSRRGFRLDETSGPQRDRLPSKYNFADIQVTGLDPVPIARWEEPGREQSYYLAVHTRTSALLGIIFGQKMDWGQMIFAFLAGVAILFLIVEMISLVIGITMTRTITQAVHALYEGTQRIKEGDFSHRIAVRGSDQLAELGLSFNTMTENLEKLIVVAKEKERLQSELEIAREVQSQLFPKNVPVLKSLQVEGVCAPARMVSGDYYDFMRLADSNLAFAIGDVAGKGISAALLMAAIQSTMRTQLSARMPMAAAAGNGGGHDRLSTAFLVSQLNKQLYANTSPEKYATFYFGLYDEDTQTLTYTNAGHLPPILLRKGAAEMLDVTGTVVGAFPFSRYDEKEIRLESGDVLVGYTDGIVEPENEYGEMFGEDRLKELLVRHAGKASGEIIARVMEAVHQWTGSGELQDDMTIVVARRL